MRGKTPESAKIRRLLAEAPPTSAAFIVTVYGDVAAPRGEALWIGSLIEICSRVGISENLARTATSRLTAAGRLEGERIGRRSFYRLTASARAEFQEAARILYAAAVEPQRWLVLHAPGLAEDEIRRRRMARMGGDVWIMPDLGEPPPHVDLILRAEIASNPAALAGFWDLESLRARYAALLTRFAPLAEELASGAEMRTGDALAARLLLVHAYRAALLRDPCLPVEALPPDWPGAEARALFRNLYKTLSPAAEAEIRRSLEGREGPLPPVTPQTQARLAGLA